jgi:hypothetical protein
MRQLRVSWVPLAATIVVLLALIPSTPASDCRADVTAELRKDLRKDNSRVYIFKVDVRTEAECAMVHFDLVTDESESGSESRMKTTRYSQKVRSGNAVSRKVNYAVSLETTVNSWEFKVHECKPCGSVD